MTLLNGGCLCGHVRYTCQPPVCAPTYCHCESCRKASGAVALPWFTVATATFTDTHQSISWYVSSPGVQRGFCQHCGTPVAYRHHERSTEIDLTVGTLDAPEAAAPVDHIWMADALSWDDPLDGRPQHLGRRPTTHYD